MSRNLQNLQLYFVCFISISNICIYNHTHIYIIYIHMYIRSIDWESPWKPRKCGSLTLLGFAASKHPLADDFSRTLRMNRRRKPTPRSKTVSTAGCPKWDISVKIRDFHFTTWYLAGVSCQSCDHQSHEIDNTHWLWSCLVSIKTSVRSENARQKGG